MDGQHPSKTGICLWSSQLWLSGGVSGPSSYSAGGWQKETRCWHLLKYQNIYKHWAHISTVNEKESPFILHFAAHHSFMLIALLDIRVRNPKFLPFLTILNSEIIYSSGFLYTENIVDWHGPHWTGNLEISWDCFSFTHQFDFLNRDSTFPHCKAIILLNWSSVILSVPCFIIILSKWKSYREPSRALSNQVEVIKDSRKN